MLLAASCRIHSQDWPRHWPQFRASTELDALAGTFPKKCPNLPPQRCCLITPEDPPPRLHIVRRADRIRVHARLHAFQRYQVAAVTAGHYRATVWRHIDGADGA